MVEWEFMIDFPFFFFSSAIGGHSTENGCAERWIVCMIVSALGRLVLASLATACAPHRVSFIWYLVPYRGADHLLLARCDACGSSLTPADETSEGAMVLGAVGGTWALCMPWLGLGMRKSQGVCFSNSAH